MGRSSIVVRLGTAVLALAAAWPAASFANEGGESDPGYENPVYKRKAWEWPHGGWNDSWHGGGHQHMEQPVSGGWFQRPYPYHLDYYRMKYSGSYAPYFGNLYGPPAVSITPPYYGDHGPYDGSYGYPGGNGYPGNGYTNGYYGEPAYCPCAPDPSGTTYQVGPSFRTPQEAKVEAELLPSQ